MDQSRFEHDNVATTLTLAARHRQADRTQGKNILARKFTTLFCVLYVDNGAFPFEDRLQLELGLSLIHNHFLKFGIEMHIGRGNKASKTEFIFFPPPGFFHQKKTVSYEINGKNMARIRRSKHVKGELHENKYKREESLCITLTETKQITVANDNVSFCPHFKYLDSWISFSLRDDHDVAKQIASVNASMGAMAPFWNDDHVDVYSKYLIF